MKRLVYALVATLCLAGSAFADHEPGHNTVRVGGHEYHTGLLRRPKTEGLPRFSFSPDYIAGLPESYDARTETNCIPPIRNQGQCGSCWSFARTGALETAVCKATGELKNLAEQDALVNDKTAYGCDGGFMDGDFEVQKGVTSEEQCPYRANDNVACNGTKVAHATKWSMIGGANSPSVDDLRASIYTYGSIAVTVAAGGSFNPVNGRILTCGSTSINHMVQLVAYRPTLAGTGYEFLIKNSWGTSWGDAGYAWSKQGCNRLAVDSGDAALFFYVEGTPGPGPGPQPQPVPAEGLPYSVVAPKGKQVALQAKPVAGAKYKWTVGSMTQTGARIFVQTTTPVEAVLQVTDAAKNVTTYTVKVGVQ